MEWSGDRVRSTTKGSVQERLTIIQGDLLDQNSLIEALRISEPDEVYNLGAQSFVLGDPTKARTKLGWVPKMTFEELIKMMVDNDLRSIQGKPYGNRS
jgi:GDP-D-mannose dehydratase